MTKESLKDYDAVPIEAEGGVSELMIVRDLTLPYTYRCGVVIKDGGRWCVRWMDGGSRYFDSVDQLKRNTALMTRMVWPQ